MIFRLSRHGSLKWRYPVKCLAQENTSKLARLIDFYTYPFKMLFNKREITAIVLEESW